jgi:hypothetical protein
MKTKETRQILAEVQRVVDATPPHAMVCPPLHWALLVRIAEELTKIVSRETTQPEDRG